MCLSIVTKRYPKKDSTEGYGWKVFEETKKGFTGPIFCSCSGYKKAKLYRRKIRKIGSGIDVYDSGFHIFLTRKDAKKYKANGEIIKKVAYKGIICDGIQNETDGINDYSLETRVVKQMMIV